MKPLFQVLDALPDSFTWPVSAEVPINGGDTVTLDFEVEYYRIEDTRLKEMSGAPGYGDRVFSNEEVISEAVKCIRALDENGGMQELTQEELDRLYRHRSARQAIVLALYVAHNGEKAKNSPKPHGTGRRK